MKNLFFTGLISLLFGCSGNASTSKDAANGIDNPQLDTSTSSPMPNGYTPPNTKVDTTQATKDSMNASKH